MIGLCGRGESGRLCAPTYLWDGLAIHGYAVRGWDVEVFGYFYGLGDLTVSGDGVVLDFD